MKKIISFIGMTLILGNLAFAENRQIVCNPDGTRTTTILQTDERYSIKFEFDYSLYLEIMKGLKEYNQKLPGDMLSSLSISMSNSTCWGTFPVVACSDFEDSNGFEENEQLRNKQIHVKRIMTYQNRDDFHVRFILTTGTQAFEKDVTYPLKDCR